jgi:hypothetical protein
VVVVLGPRDDLGGDTGFACGQLRFKALGGTVQVTSRRQWRMSP